MLNLQRKSHPLRIPKKKTEAELSYDDTAFEMARRSPATSCSVVSLDVGISYPASVAKTTLVAGSPELFGGIKRVKSMLGHMSEAMSRHYARMAETEHMNQETMLLIPEIGKRPDWIGKQAK